MAKATHQYEAMFLFGQSAAQDLEAATNQVRQIVERHEGQVLVLKKWDERKLAYEIKKQKRGTYIICYYRAPGSSVAAIERDVNLSDNVLRVLVTDADHLNQKEMEAVEPQPIIREERPSWERPMSDDRPRRDDRPRGPRRDEHAAEPAGAEKE
ncbi:MAG TPA: 30S ribosomal protein S6 [Tepidisphaeraceae bacterium]|jgi:small subunit ribosomal protein S6|nr:30S ribosomal protein S6 [Tepidisphaeraceae bacterium]